MKKLSYIFLSLILGTGLLVSCSDDSTGPEEEPEQQLGQLFVSSNTTPVLGVFDFSDRNDITSLSFGISSTDTDGLVYVSDDDVLYQASRSNNRLDVYTGLTETENGTNISLSGSSSSDFSNARKIAINGNSVLVAQDAAGSNNQQNRFFVYQVSEGSATLQNTYAPQINLWDVQFDDDRLYAVVDNSNMLAAFDDILDNSDGDVTADQIVGIEGIVRTHAFSYSPGSDIMIMSDIGEAGSDSDGALHIITDFSSKFDNAGDDGTITTSQQIIIEGSNTQLGNPVGVAYDTDNQIIFVAERAVDGGRVLAFDFPSDNGNPSPFFSEQYNGASAVYFAE